MPNWEKLEESLRQNGFEVIRFASGKEAADYLNAEIDGKTVGIGGSVTIQELGLYESLGAHNEVFWHWDEKQAPGVLDRAAGAEIYLTSVNGLAETGEIINIDGNGNRLASTLYGHQQVYFVVGANKVAEDFDAALWRARNIAGPKNAVRLHKKTPCAVKGDKCYNCKSPERICGAMLTFWRRPKSIPQAKVILVEEELGY